MTLRIYSIRDFASNTYGTPFFSTNDKTALRDFGHLKSDSRSLVGSYPHDFKLFCLGVFDDATGKIVPDNFLVEDLEIEDNGTDS